jgi:heterodisulfide reductase subunit B
LALALPARNLAIAEQMELKTVLAPCAACFSRHRAAEIKAREDEALRSKIEGIIDMEFKASSHTISVLEWLAQDVGIEKIKEKVKKPLKGMKAACYYGCLLVRPAVKVPVINSIAITPKIIVTSITINKRKSLMFMGIPQVVEAFQCFIKF